MKNRILFCMFLLGVGAFFAMPSEICAQDEGAIVPPEIENEQILEINREAPHATLMPYANMDEALAARRHESSFCRSLNGDWKFHWAERPELRPTDFYKPEFDVSAWKEIPVPSNWQVLGYGTPHYRNFGYIFEPDWPRVMSEPPENYTALKERNPVGSYRREFEVPEAWKGRRVYVTFDGVDAAFYLWINGKSVGYSTNSRNAAQFDITKYLQPGKNTIAVEVYRYCAGSYLEDQDMWRLSGIFRNVTLWSAPDVQVRDFRVDADLDKDYKDGKLLVTAKVRNCGTTEAAGRALKVALYDAARKPGPAAEVNVPPLAPGQEAAVEASLDVAAPAKWTAETPNLYTAVLKLENGPATEEILSCRTGFRKIETKGRVFTVNGVPVKLKGVNRHEHWPDTGHAITEEQMVRDLELIKQANCNHVRTCHYSDDPRWYELCDEWGIYLTAEANVEDHGLRKELQGEKRLEKDIVARNVANVESFKNHPSVVMWSLGNECNGGSNFVSALEAVKAIDPTRPVHYEPFGIGKGNPADVDSQMYATLEEVEKAARDGNLTKPYYLCEYAHAMFNSMGNLGDYNDLIDKYPEIMGAAIWEWQDQGLWNRRDPKRPILAYGGGFGEFPNDKFFIHKGVVFSDRSPKPHFPEVKRAYQWIAIKPANLAAGEIEIANKYQFTGLQDFQGSWTVSENGTVIDSGKLGPLAIAPGAKEIVRVPFKKIAPKPGAEYFLRVGFTDTKDRLWAKAGFEVAAEQFKLPVETPPAPERPGKTAPLTLEEDGNQISVAGKGFAVAFDKTTGRISKITQKGAPLLLPDGGPKLHLWRAPHRTDDMWLTKDWAKYGIKDLPWVAEKVVAEKQGGSVRVSASLKAEGKEGFGIRHEAVYTIRGDGTVLAENTVTPALPDGKKIAFARMGVRMLLVPGLDRCSYFGRGPMENYADRKRGSDVGVYSGTVKELMTPYAKPMECGNHEDVRWIALSGRGLPGIVVRSAGALLQASALPFTDEEMEPADYSIDLPKPSATILTVSAKTTGVGSHGCGSKPLPQDVVWSDPAQFSYLLQLLPKK